MKNEKYIILAGLISEPNLGDPIIMGSTRFLISQTESIANENYLEVDISPSISLPFIYKILHRLGLLSDEKFSLLYKRIFKSKYEDIITQAKAIIFVGGGIVKFKYQNCYIPVMSLCLLAEKYNIPVVFSSVGVEDYDENDVRCLELKHALNKKCVKGFTVRDDINKLYNYITPKVYTDTTIDPAIVSDLAYKVNTNKSGLIGIGIIRSGIFTHYENAMTDDDYITLIVKTIKKLLHDGFKVELFTNGYIEDLNTARKIKTKLNSESIKVSISHPSEPVELIELISKYEAIIASRMHACIIAYATNVPFVGLVWNRKLLQFGERIGYANRMLEVNSLTPDTICCTLDEAIIKRYDVKERDYNRKIVVEKFNKLIKKTLATK